jgi:hypothetical protein
VGGLRAVGIILLVEAIIPVGDMLLTCRERLGEERLRHPLVSRRC